MSHSTVRERQRRAREEVILEVAYDILAEQGYDKMSMDDLAARAGLSKATLYQHFPSKEDVVVSVVTRMMRMGEDDLIASDSALPAITRLDQGLRRSLNRRFKLWNNNITIQPLKVMHHARFQEHHARLAALLEVMVEQSKTQGDINPNLSTVAAAHMMLWLFRIDFTAICTQQRCTVDEAINTVVTVIINGLKPTGNQNTG
jgi:AcrR family transcriptional regulator